MAIKSTAVRLVTEARVATLVATSAVIGAILNFTGWPVFVYYTGSAWPTRPTFTGWTGQVIWNSEAYPGAPAPATAPDGDKWQFGNP